MGTYQPAASDCIFERNSKYPVDRVIIHVAEASTLASTVNWFKVPGRSVPTATHFVVGPDGEVVQMVLMSKKCLHAGSKTQSGWNDRSVGVEVIGWTNKTIFPEAQIKSLALLIKDICKKYKIPLDRKSIIGHSEVPGTTHYDPGNLFPWEDLMKLLVKT